MAGYERLLSIATVLAFVTGASAQDAQNTPPVRGRQNQQNAQALENVRKAIEALTPEQKKRFQENFARWANLSPEEKRALRDRDEFRRKRMIQEIDRAIQTGGFELQEEQRVQFAKRYAEERRKLEEQIRKESEERRQTGIEEIISRLKTEFSNAPANAKPVATAPAP